MSRTDWGLDVKVVKDGPVFKDKGSFEMEGYNRIDVVVPQGESLVVNVHAGDLDDIHLLYIKRTDEPEEPEEGQDPPKRELSYTFGSLAEPVELTDLHVVLGAGAIRLLCDAPNELCFTNEGDQDADVTILVCREASGPCEPSAEQDGETDGESGDGKGETPPSEPPQGQYPPEQGPQQKDEPSGGTPQQQSPQGGKG